MHADAVAWGLVCGDGLQDGLVGWRYVPQSEWVAGVIDGMNRIDWML